MSRYYDKDLLKESLDPEQIFDLLELWGGEPTWEDKCIISNTICHNIPGEGSHKLYYYFGTRLLHCYTGCSGEPTFDIFQLCIKVMKNQRDLDWELYDAMDYIAGYFGFEGAEFLDEEQSELKDWDIFKQHERKQSIRSETPQLKEYNPIILTRLAYPRIAGWEREGIAADVSRKNLIGYYPGGEQITIPHYDMNNRLIGIRGRYLAKDQAERYGKYRPLLIGKTLYTHPLSMNLYHLNKTKDNIKRARIAVIFESEKSCLQYESYYGQENDISVACCGSSISNYQIDLLRTLGVKDIIIAFDRQFIEIGDEEFIRLKNKLIYLYNKFSPYVGVTAIFDKNKITSYKAGPLDEGKEKFEILLRERIVPCSDI